MGLISAGKLDRRVEILRRGSPVDNGLTVVPGDWGVLCERAASIKPRMGRELIQAGTRGGEAQQSVWLRFDEVTRTIDASDAVRIDGSLFEIIAPPLEIGRREGIELLIVAGVPA